MVTKYVNIITRKFPNGPKKFLIRLATTKTLLSHTIPVVGNRKNVSKIISYPLLCGKQKNIRNKQDELTLFQSTEKIKQNPDLNKINKQKITDKRYKTIKIHDL